MIIHDVSSERTMAARYGASPEFENVYLGCDSLKIMSIHQPIGGHGGVESVSMRLDTVLTRRGHAYTTVLLGPSTVDRAWETNLSSVVVGPVTRDLTVKTMPAITVPIFRFIQRQLKKLLPDVVLVSWAPLVSLVRWGLRSTGLASHTGIVAYERGYYSRLAKSSRIFRRTYLYGLQHANGVICGSRIMRKRCAGI